MNEMRRLMDLVEDQIPSRPATKRPKLVYHGTSVEQWSRDASSPDGLYVTTSRVTAATYAREWGAEGEQPILIAIDLASFPDSSFGPNIETVEQYEDGAWPSIGKEPDELDWSDTLAMNGTFVIHGFDEARKESVKVTPLGRRPVQR